MNKAPPNSLYSKLTEDQRAQLYDWILTLGYAKTKERIALPEPEGFGITTHISSIHRFYLRYVAELDAGHAAEAEDVSAPPPARLFPLAEQAAHAGAFRLAATPLDTDSFGELSHWVSTQQANQLRRDYIRIADQNAAIAEKKAALAEKRHAFDREKYELNVARLALKHAASFQRIHHDSDLDIQARIKAAREAIYGPPPDADSVAGTVQFAFSGTYVPPVL